MPFYTNNYQFTKTGSGQTQGNHSKRDAFACSHYRCQAPANPPDTKHGDHEGATGTGGGPVVPPNPHGIVCSGE
jgi:hypothetical protein